MLVAVRLEVEQTSAAARNLASEVSALSDQASKFEVGNAARVETSVRAAVPARPAKPRGYVSPVKPLAAPVPAPAGAGEWASF